MGAPEGANSMSVSGLCCRRSDSWIAISVLFAVNGLVNKPSYFASISVQGPFFRYTSLAFPKSFIEIFF